MAHWNCMLCSSPPKRLSVVPSPQKGQIAYSIRWEAAMDKIWHLLSTDLELVQNLIRSACTCKIQEHSGLALLRSTNFTFVHSFTEGWPPSTIPLPGKAMFCSYFLSVRWQNGPMDAGIFDQHKSDAPELFNACQIYASLLPQLALYYVMASNSENLLMVRSTL